MKVNKYHPEDLFLELKSKKTRIFLLIGGLGEGKTTFVQKFLGNNAVTSPTFSVCHTYKQKINGIEETISHFDLYRMENDPLKIENSGLIDALKNHITFIEWPDKISMDYYKPFLSETAILRFCDSTIYLL